MSNDKYLNEDATINYEILRGAFGNKYKDAPVVIIDSGLGGLKIAQEIKKQKPSENIVVFADTEFMPLGNKDSRIVTRRVVKAIAKLKKLEPKAVVLACNTIDALAGDKLVSQLGAIPLYRIVDKTAVQAVKLSKTKEVGLLATTNTIDSQKYMLSMLGYSPNTHLIGLECYNLAQAIETDTNKKEVFKEEVAPLHDFKIDTLILGCTHYSHIMPMIKKEFPNVDIVDSSKVIVDFFLEDFQEKQLFNVANKGQLFIIASQVNASLSDNVSKNFGTVEHILLEDKL